MAQVAVGARVPGKAAGKVERALALVPQSDPRWRALLARSQAATPFHHPAWSSALAATYGYRPFAALLVAGDEPLAGLPVLEVSGPGPRRRRWLSLPFTDECAPLATDAEAHAALLAQLDARRRADGVRGLELRAEAGVPGAAEWTAGVTHVLELAGDPEAVRSTFSRSQVQRNIARAQREGVRVERGEAEADLVERFYRLHIATRRRQGVPVQPRRFFAELWRRVVEPGLGFVLVAYAGDEPAAAALFLAWKSTVIYKFGASDARRWPLRPNHLLFWEAIRASCEQGFRRFDFGRTELGNAGLRAFKAGWGTREQPLRYARFGAESPTGEREGLLAAAVRSSVRRGPALWCRALGAALYRYAA